MVKVIFFASIREDLGLNETEVALDGPSTVADLVKLLVECHGAKWSEALSRENTLVAVNQTMVDDQHTIHAGDEVAFFPPVTGG
ncbi:molybdopterin converting factor subunit 1 [Pseudomonadales bacterium]|nr:molybdopterin converting factor subunit 1 [Pseudomonadales bacterium]MDA9366046.1 molybdopterin converting factor subunit 1 [Pseudomonadales bacterium]MDB4150115.1 molybdopterin converting factor subunit 1 [Pseudomonadales bacterium]MDB9868422.1 molybdopterin converting factor subunit 1 [Pseudomonadales bacterium]MDB9879934.1 molybdopterin converting factor subunit 1 [Pseudomonadales bacterium]|tara:strand:- start:136 stop:387 length:252 start_codon:yes stop_codon:yes gene_type:complete